MLLHICLIMIAKNKPVNKQVVGQINNLVLCVAVNKNSKI